MRRTQSFNPRLREGGDIGCIRGSSRWVVSIHASAREATRLHYQQPVGQSVSIHASAREATFADA